MCTGLPAKSVKIGRTAPSTGSDDFAAGKIRRVAAGCGFGNRINAAIIEAIMGKRIPQVDAYIERSADFAKPILNHLRELVHVACPEAEEAIKWNSPRFMYRGILCNLAAFKQHCAFGFWHPQMRSALGKPGEQEAMGQFGRITNLADLPSDAQLKKLVRQAMKLNEAPRVPTPPKPQPPRPPLKVPADLRAALNSNAEALRTFENFSYSHKREYIQWISEAKREETRQRRIKTAIEQMSQGKSQNWKYE
jgi:uncharacterized protein YdeI (YjbR/CyaY-like superfamily)